MDRKKPPFKYTPAGINAYALNTGVSDTDLRSLIGARMTQLDAMLVMTFGECGESLRAMSGSLQDNYMWACSSMLDEIRALLEQTSVGKSI